MKKIIFTVMISLMLSCSEDVVIDNCGCFETQEVLRTIKLWTGGDWIYFDRFVETGAINYIDGCYTEEETKYMTFELNDRERWYVTCLNN